MGLGAAVVVELGVAAVAELDVAAGAVAGLDVAPVALAWDVAEARVWQQAWEQRAWREHYCAAQGVEGISSRPAPSRGTRKPRVWTV